MVFLVGTRVGCGFNGGLDQNPVNLRRYPDMCTAGYKYYVCGGSTELDGEITANDTCDILDASSRY